MNARDDSHGRSTVRLNRVLSVRLIEHAIGLLTGPLSRIDRWVVERLSVEGTTSTNADLANKGYGFVPDCFSAFDRLEVIAEHRNEYLSKLILNRESVELLVESLLENPKVRERLLGYAGTPYRVDALHYRENRTLPGPMANEYVYGNTWHIDVPLSRFTVKLFLAVEDIDGACGPLTLLDPVATREAMRLGFARDADDLSEELHSWLRRAGVRFTGRAGDACLAAPNRCLHRAAVPDSGRARRQIMLQLNPASRWGYRQDLAENQAVSEPRFPFFRFSTPSVEIRDPST